MKARILEKSEEHLWDKFIQKHPLATIHQASVWGHFQEKIPSKGKYWIIILEQDSKIIGGTLLIKQKLPKSHSWLYAARGPLLDYNSKNIQEQMENLLTTLKTIAKKENAIFLRIDPPLEKEKKFKGFYTIKYGFQPEHTLILDLKKTEEELLKLMKPKGRYNIRLAEKKGVEIIKVNPKDNKKFNAYVDNFYEILKETTQRDQFHGHDKDYYRMMIEMLSLSDNAHLYLAEYNSEIIAGIIVTYFKDTATYYFGASGNKDRNVMAPYLLHWYAIKEAKVKNFKYYDFFGIAPSNAKNHPWQGVTEFKKKFGGEEKSYIKAQEYPFKKFLYLIYRIYKRLRHNN